MCVGMYDVVAWTSEVLLIFLNCAFLLVFRMQGVCFQAPTLLTSQAPELSVSAQLLYFSPPQFPFDVCVCPLY